jgi:hypothetical protein
MEPTLAGRVTVSGIDLDDAMPPPPAMEPTLAGRVTGPG